MSPFPHLSTGRRTEKTSAQVKHETVRAFPNRGRREGKPNQMYMCFYTNAETVKKEMGKL